MKIKIFLTTALCLLAVLIPSVVQAYSFSVRLGKPKSPTNQNYLKLTYVALDSDNREITVKCFKKGPSESIFSQFDSAKTMIPGGNTDTCLVDSNILNTQGDYSFYVTGEIGSELVKSNEVSLTYNTQAPGEPGDYSKEKINSCDYRIKFKTSADNGKTIKVQLFRSDTFSIAVDGNNVIASQNIGSNQNGEFVNTVPDCNKNYYYVIRSVDSSDNVSGTVGDSFTTTTTTNSTVLGTTSGDQVNQIGALVISSGSQVSAPDGNGTNDPKSGETKPSSDSGTPATNTESTPEVLGTSTENKNYAKWIFVPVLLVVGYILLTKKQKIS